MNDNAHKVFTDQTKLAGAFLDDGAPFSAASILRKLAADLERIGRERQAEFQPSLKL